MSTRDADIKAGLEDGLRFAMVMDKDGRVHDLDWTEVESWTPAEGFLWVHLERDDPRAQDWLCRKSGVDPLVALALIADESRPRVDDVDDGLMVVLRGVNLAEPAAEAELVPIHVWVEDKRCISLRDKAHQLSALRDLRLALMVGKGPRTPGDLIAAIADKVVDHLGLVIDAMEEQITEQENTDPSERGDIRGDISWARRRVIQLRRYLGPQRDALYRLQHDDATWLGERAKLNLREVSDKLLRHIEDLDELRDRATVLHEDMTALVSENIAKTSNRLTAIAAMVLPPTLLTGMLGSNIGGVPGGGEPNAFLILCIIILVMMPLTWIGMKALKWL
jgi:zinc transporter